MDLTCIDHDADHPHPITGLRGAFPHQPTDIDRARAGNAAFKRALMLQYSARVAGALRRQAARAARAGETPDQTARRIVPRPHESATAPRDPNRAA